MLTLKRIAGGIDRVVEASGQIASWLTLALVLVMSGNVLLRYLFSIGSVASQELEWHLLSPIVLLGMSYALLRDGHLRVDLLYVKFSARTRALVDLAAACIGVLFAAFVIQLSRNYIHQSWSILEGSPDPGGLPYRFLLKGFIPLGFSILLLHFIAEAIRALLALAMPASVAGEKP